MNSQEKEIIILFFVRRIGPYHHARFNCAAKFCSLVVVETRALSVEYPWEFEPTSRLYRARKFAISNHVEKGLRGRDLVAEVRETFEQIRPSVVVTTGWADPEYHSVILEADRQKVPRVVISDSRFEDEPRRWYKELLKTVVVGAFSSAVVAGQASFSYLNRLGFPAQSIYHPWDVVDNDHFRSESLTPFGERPILCVCRFVKKKNLTTLVKSYAQYRQLGGNRKMWLVGSGPEYEILSELIDGLELTGFCSILEFVQYDDLPQLYAKGFCLILPSVTDQWGLVVNEAMASSIPVLVSKNCGCAVDLVEPKVNGLLFDPFDQGSITKSLLEISDLDEDAWVKAGNASRTIIEKWSLESFASALNDSAREALRIGPRPISRIIHSLLLR